jgi:hypothetical protein
VAQTDDLAALQRKYQEIIRLREQALRDPAKDPRREMAELAAEFPGALREADELPMEELHVRLRALAAAEAGEAVAPWMAVMTRFHALTRGALCAKKWLGGRKNVDDDVIVAFDAAVSALCYAADAAAWRDDLDRLASPPNGRVTELVFDRMSTELGLTSAELRDLVFVRRRSSPR